jgi:methylglutaconyl-CoA hydratase
METLQIERKNNVTTIWLNRPALHNAFDEIMVKELTTIYSKLNKDKSTRVIVLRAKGQSFSSGADINWMKKAAKYSDKENIKEAANLAECFLTIYSSPKPTIAVVHGASFGGANGLFSSCDIAIAVNNSIFSFSEVNLGIIPAVISPYIIKRIGEYPSKELMLTGMRFSSRKAKIIGLVNQVCLAEEVENELEKYVSLFLSSGPNAISLCKKLINKVTVTQFSQEQINYTVEQIAVVRKSSEGQEGMNAFVAKRKPNWRT